MPDKRTTKSTRTPLQRMTELTRRLVAVPKAEIAKRKAKKRKRH